MWVHAKNCQDETTRWLRKGGFDTEEILLKELEDGKYSIMDYEFVVSPGGFGHGDHIRAGKRVGLRLKILANDWEDFYEQGLCFMGICNGFQDQVQGGFLTTKRKAIADQEFSLLPNEFGPYRTHEVYLKNVSRGNCIYTDGIDELLTAPMRHAEGRFFVKGLPEDRSLLDKLHEQDQVVFKYVAPDGSYLENASSEMKKKWCYNGSTNSVAAICDPNGIWMGIMPHPEARYNPFTDPLWTSETGPRENVGLLLVKNALSYLKK